MTSDPNGKANKGDEGRRSNKWWEQYYVRYFVGTVIGAVILLALREFAMVAAGFAKVVPLATVSALGITAFTAAGLAYCYIASAPILVLHSLRGGLGFFNPPGWVALIVYLCAFLGIPAAGLAAAVHIGSRAALGWILVVGIMLAQLVAIVVAQRRRFQEIRVFYDRLVKARRNERREGTDYCDSYRHMREHGNAVSIVILEVLVGVALATASSELQLVSMLVLWLAPAGYVWFVATVIEFHFADAHKKVP